MRWFRYSAGHWEGETPDVLTCAAAEEKVTVTLLIISGTNHIPDKAFVGAVGVSMGISMIVVVVRPFVP